MLQATPNEPCTTALANNPQQKKKKKKKKPNLEFG
jgi:hypothetical protein